ncbi:MAG: Na+:solute symporter [Planctomycetes bacterium]|nr:Na+:solute symporter [Planctomycetota bacterium]
MQLHAVDWLIIVAYFAVSLGIGLWYKKRAGESFVEYFASGRSLPWWIAGTSMVATTFAADTPLAVTGLVAKNGLAGNWFWWAFALGGMCTVFVFAKLWRRAEVLTDVEFVELRYRGPAAAFLRGFRGLYIAVIMNSIIIGWVTKAMADVLKQTVLVGTPAGSTTDFWLVAAMLLITGVYCVLSGMWGVAITDVIQFVLAMAGCIALAVIAVDHVGGTDALQQQLAANLRDGGQALRYLPDFGLQDPWMPIGVFLVMVFAQWWATWYPGTEPGGGGYIVQRMASCKDEQHAVKATLLFQLAHYCLRPWPWILVAFAAMAMHPELRAWATDGDKATDPGVGYPMLIRELAPVGLRGLLLVTFAAAFMSTIATQMNWGASYLVNDVYKRFVRKDASERQLLRASRLASVLVLLLGGFVAWFMIVNHVSVDDAWKFLAALGAGVGLVFILRWFWWRINAWSEIAAMVGSLVFFAAVNALWPDLNESYAGLLVALLSLLLWLVVTLATRPESAEVLAAFYRKVRPDGPGWGPIAAACPDVRPDGKLGLGIACALLGTTVIWTTLPGIGAVIFGEWGTAAACLGSAAVATFALLRLAARLRAPTGAAV